MSHVVVNFKTETAFAPGQFDPEKKFPFSLLGWYGTAKLGTGLIRTPEKISYYKFIMSF